MNYAWRLVLLLVLSGDTCAHGASLLVEDHGDQIYSFYLNGEADNGTFDTVIVEFSPKPGYEYLNLLPDAEDPGPPPRVPGEPWTFINAFLSAPRAFGGNGFYVLGPIDRPDLISFTVGPLGETIDTANDPNNGPLGLFLFNYQLNRPGDYDAGSNYEIQLVRAGSIIRTLTNAPEPTGVTLLITSAVSAACVRSRNASAPRFVPMKRFGGNFR